MIRLGPWTFGIVIATAMVTDLSLVRPAAETSPADHEAHHPPGTASQVESQASPSQVRQPSPAPSAAPMQGAGMEQMMKEMERMMGFPPRKPLMSRLLDVDRLSERERHTLRIDAERQAQGGLTLLQDGFRELEKARRTRNDAAITRAVQKLQEGMALWETASAVQRALSAPAVRPREGAVRWFKEQMNIEAQPPPLSPLPWGVSWTHFVVMMTLAVVTVVLVGLYLYRVRRALALLRGLSRRDGGS